MAIIAFDLVNGTSQNRTSRTITPDNSGSNGAFAGSIFDVFGITDRTINFDFADDSAGSFASDTFGFVATGDTAPFFGVEDLDNGDNAGGTGTAVWVFDISGATSLTDITIDFAAMGDFEAGDNGHSFTASIDGGSAVTLFDIDSDESIAFGYTMEGGATVTLNDPLTVNGTGLANVIPNSFTTFSSSALSGMSGSTLTITYEAGANNGGSEAFGFREIVVNGTEGAPAPGNIVITEIMQNPKAVLDADGEWFEITNTGGTAVDINGWTIRDDGSDSHVIDNGGPLLVAPGAYVVLGSKDDGNINGGVAVDYAYAGFTLANGADEIILVDGTGTEIDRVAYDGGTAFPDPDGASMELNDPTNDNSLAANWAEATAIFGDGDLGTPGAANGGSTDGGTPTARFIHEIQGAGAVSPELGNVVTVTAVVTADFQDAADSDFNGFFLQEETADEDADPLTSEGIFVFEGANAVDVNVGDLVTVTGTVSEFAGETQISGVTSVTVDAAPGIGAVTPAIIGHAADDGLVAGTTTNADGNTIADYEAYEGMLVTVPETLTVSDLFTLGRYNEVSLTAGGRIANFTQENAPSVADYAQWVLDTARRGLLIDDPFNDDGAQNSDPVYPQGGGLDADVPRVLRSGDTVTGLTGVITYRDPSSFEGENYRLIPTEEPVFTAANPRDATPSVSESDYKVASFNVLNYFNGNGLGGGFPTSRGASNADEFDRQRDKIIDAIATIDADVVGLIEIENDGFGTNSAIADLVAGLNLVSSRSYAFVDPGTSGVGTDEIAVGFIYDTSTTSLSGAAEILDKADDARFDSDNQRASLAQTFSETASGESFTAVVNHFKSKGSSAGNPGDADIGDGQAASNGTRTDAAEALVDWLATDPTGSGDEDFLILGDLNAYFMEDPIQAILEGADDIVSTADDFTSLVDAGDYSYAFPVGLDSVNYVQVFGTLDYALANSSLLGQVTSAEAWHINADEPAVLDYNTDFTSAAQDVFLYNDDPFRSSDHDPIVVGLDLGGAATVNMVAGTAGNDALTGTDGADLIIGNGGGLDRMRGMGTGDGDIFDLSAIRADSGRNVVRIHDYEEGETIRGFLREDIDQVRSFGDTLYLSFSDDRDLVVLTGTNDIEQVVFEDLPIA